MPTYILIHNPNRPNQSGIRENPAREIANNICDGKRALTKFGGWSIEVNQGKIQPEDRLLFYRSGNGLPGFFAVGRALSSNDCKCCELRKAELRKWYPDNPAADKLVDMISGLAAYKALGWDEGKGMTTHINAEWEVVVDPKKVKVKVVLFLPRTISTESESAQDRNRPDATFPMKSRTKFAKNARSPGTACRHSHPRSFAERAIAPPCESKAECRALSPVSKWEGTHL